MLLIGKKFILICILLHVIVAYAGVGSGGGNDHKKRQVVVRFNEVIDRAKHRATDPRDIEAIAAIEKMLENNPPRIEFPDKTLTYCGTEEPTTLSDGDASDTNAWGCPGRLQLLPSFNLFQDDLVFHELTRVTEGYESFDDHRQSSVARLQLHQVDLPHGQYKTFWTREKFDPRLTIERLMRARDLRMKANAIRVIVSKGPSVWYLDTEWPVSVSATN